MDQFPANSANPLGEGAKEAKSVKSVVVTPAVVQKPGFRKRLRDSLTGGSEQSIVDYVVFEVAIPALKDLFVDATTQAVERAIFGESRGGRRSNRPLGSSGPVNYTRYSTQNRDGGSYSRSRPETSRTMRSSSDFDDLLLATRVEANQVIDRLFDLLAQYEEVSVADLYELVGLSPVHTDHKYGWRSLQGATHRRVRDGYVLDLPKPIHLDG